MPFNPNLPQPNTPADADVMRAQLNALHDENTALAATVATQAGAIAALQASVAALQQTVADNLADTSHNIWGQMPNLDPGYTPSDPPVPGDITWLRDRIVEMNNALARA